MVDPQQEEPIADYPRLSYVVRPKINLAFQQNAVPIISELVVTNDTEKTFEDLTLRVESDPQFASTRIWTLDRLQPDTRFHIIDVKIDVSHAFLADLKEAVRGSLTFTLKQGDTVLDIQKEEVGVLAKDEWGGNTVLPEIIAAFVQPNDPAVEVILREASKRLRSANQDGSFDGYQSRSPQRVANVVSSVWSAISGLQISYAVPPASFEKIGQKIRPPSQILERRLATCLDLSLLFVSCLEQVGLNPLIIFSKGHAFPGCWLQDEDFSHSVIDDLQSIRKREQLKELLVFETTLVARIPAVKFSFAVHDANSRLQNEVDFDLAVDIKRARMSGICPVYEIEPLKTLPTGEEEEVEVPLNIIEDLPQSTDQEIKEEPVSIETPTKRLERWKRKLLDLSLRNRMLNLLIKNYFFRREILKRVSFS